MALARSDGLEDTTSPYGSKGFWIGFSAWLGDQVWLPTSKMLECETPFFGFPHLTFNQCPFVASDSEGCFEAAVGSNWEWNTGYGQLPSAR